MRLARLLVAQYRDDRDPAGLVSVINLLDRIVASAQEADRGEGKRYESLSELFRDMRE